MTNITPPTAPLPRLMDHSERLATFGTPARLGKDGGLVADPTWEQQNLVVVMVPWPIQDSRWGFARPLKVHRKAAQQFMSLFSAWKAAGKLPLLKTLGGAHCTRMKRGKEGSRNLADLSTHSFGAAVDLNVAWNQLGTPGALVGTIGSVVELVSIAEEHGFVWGGRWKRSDPMHFEVAAPAQPLPLPIGNAVPPPLKPPKK